MPCHYLMRSSERIAKLKRFQKDPVFSCVLASKKMLVVNI